MGGEAARPRAPALDASGDTDAVAYLDGPFQQCIASAGHPPPLLHRPGEPCAVSEVAPGPLPGVLADSQYPVTEHSLPPGSHLCLYTDGLVEAPGIDPDQQLATRAARLSHLGDLEDGPLDTLIDTLLAQSSHDFPRGDDIAVLLLRTRT
jgi:serine phosphatase RsbU (regulator of sigma subunit)